MTNGNNETTEKEVQKFIKVTYHSNGALDITSEGITVFDLWSLARFLELRGDEMYITTQTANKMKEANKGTKLVTASVMPKGN